MVGQIDSHAHAPHPSPAMVGQIDSHAHAPHLFPAQLHQVKSKTCEKGLTKVNSETIPNPETPDMSQGTHKIATAKNPQNGSSGEGKIKIAEIAAKRPWEEASRSGTR